VGAVASSEKIDVEQQEGKSPEEFLVWIHAKARSLFEQSAPGLCYPPVS
jgi:hypothetical protein